MAGDKKGMYRTHSTQYGMPARLYRTTGEIRADIESVREAIFEVKERLNPRALLLDIINDERCSSPSELREQLEDALARVEESLGEMEGLREELNELEEELTQTRCELGY